jgi:hypothetical protein
MKLRYNATKCDAMQRAAQWIYCSGLDVNGRTSNVGEVVAAVMESCQVLDRATVIAASLTAVTAGPGFSGGVVANRGALTKVSCRIGLI